MILYATYSKENSKIEFLVHWILKIEENVILSQRLIELIKQSEFENIQKYFVQVSQDKRNYWKNLNKTLVYIFCQKKIIEAQEKIYVLIKKFDWKLEPELIKLAKQYKSLNIITPSIQEFSQLEELIFNQWGITITVANNTRKSIAKAKFVINIDFTEKEIQRYRLAKDAIILNLSPNKIVKLFGYEGSIINNIQLEYGEKNMTNWFERKFCEQYDDQCNIIELMGNYGPVVLQK